MSLTAFPYRSKERVILTGPGLVTSGLMPKADITAMGIRWIRWVLPSSVSNAYIDTVIQYFVAAGFAVDWLLPITVSGGAFVSPFAMCQQICARYVAFGLTSPIFELGNEFEQQNVPGNIATEALADTAYANLLTAFMASMNGYDCIIIGGNEGAAFLLHAYQVAQAAGATMPNAWGCHDYDAFANIPGTHDLLAETFMAGVIGTEGCGGTPPNVSKAQANAWFVGMSAGMGTRPWCYFLAGDATYNTTTNAYAWYSVVASTDGNGVATYSTRTATLTETATALGAVLS